MICINNPRWLEAFLLVTLFATPAARSQEEPARTLRVATKVTPPFAMKDEEGNWQGLTVDLWRTVANELNLSYEFEEATVPEMLEGLKSGKFDVAAAALTVTHEREAALDFTHSFFSSGLAIALPFDTEGGWFDVFLRVVSLDFVKALGILILVILAAGFLIWLLEKKKNPEQFGGRPSEGLAAGFWWSAVTMTTVGYGDKAPQTFWGRVVGLIWMFTSILIISSLTAAIASVLTVSQLESGIDGPEDLRGARVGAVRGTTSETYVRTISGALAYSYDSPREASAALADDQVQAVVHDAPLLRYLANTEMKGKIRVLPRQFKRQEYAMALPDKSPLRERINLVLLERIASEDWQEILNRYLGSP